MCVWVHVSVGMCVCVCTHECVCVCVYMCVCEYMCCANLMRGKLICHRYLKMGHKTLKQNSSTLLTNTGRGYLTLESEVADGATCKVDLASACNSYSCPMSRGYACALVTVVRALAHYFHVFSFAQLKLLLVFFIYF